MIQLEIGKSYYGPGEQRLRVLKVEGDQATVQYPLSLNEKAMSLKEVAEFIGGSARRTYQRASAGSVEIRTKVEEFAVPKGDQRTLSVPGFKRMRPGKYVAYITPDKNRHIVSAAQWAKWRAKVKP